MAGRRRGRTGRGWDAAPPRSSADDDTRPDEAGSRGRRRPVGDQPSRPAGAGESADPAERAREICLRLLAVRPRTRSELATALRQRGIDDAVAAEVLARYGEVGMVDDQAFARAWVSSRHHGRGLARRALAAELRHKGVDAETVGQALDELDADTEAATARALVDRKLRTERGGATEALLRRLVGMLARKGYPPGLAVRVTRDALADWPGAGRDADAATTDLDAAAEIDLDGAVVTDLDGAVVTDLDGAAVTDLDGAAVTDLDGAAVTDLDGAAVTDLDGAVATDLDLVVDALESEASLQQVEGE